tara:strand:- start:187 stop:483 length:297 start_codon:yes stop_codon:yes gene_type:complete
MTKYLRILNADGQQYLIDVTKVLGFDSTTASTTEMTIIYRPITGNNDLRIKITHATAPNAYAFQNWFVSQMESILSRNWREVVESPTPPYAVTAITNV